MKLNEEFDIIHPETFKRYVVKDLKVGSFEEIKCVEFTVVGKNHEWPFWAEYEDFKKVNPHVEL